MTTQQKIFFAVLLVAIGALARLAPHAWNFAPIVAIALFAGVYLGRTYAVAVPLAAMLVSDIFIGFASGPVTASVYISFALAGVIGIVVRRHKSAELIVVASLASSCIFYLVTNWAVWQFGTMYPHTLAGLMSSYTMALPFFRNTMLGDLFYTSALFGVYEYAHYKLEGRSAQLAKT